MTHSFWKVEVRKEELSYLLQIIHFWILIQQGDKLTLIIHPSREIFKHHEVLSSNSFSLRGFYRRLKKEKKARRRTSWGKRKWISLFPKKERRELMKTSYKIGGAAIGLAGAGAVLLGYSVFKKTPS